LFRVTLYTSLDTNHLCSTVQSVVLFVGLFVCQIKTLKDNNKRMKRLIQQRNSVRMSSIGYDNFSFTKEQLAMLEDRDQTIGDLQFSLDERTMQLEEVRTCTHTCAVHRLFLLDQLLSEL